ncbi:uncharacterized protein LOC117183007 [Belonocnema kinseyi]|uniref:uncharacterized protein LOC117183007 n=1 Tax=Belonocnema kinseyi TaxID=2817044 RepID=UPI00143D1D36|nr:uncharacterized protein LOC117183007 [Belonocnema kinseyi]
MESLRPSKDWFQSLLTLLLLASIVINVSSLNHHRDLREPLDPALEIAITDNEEETRSSSSDSVVIKAVDIPEESVTYEGSQVWRVLAQNEKAEYVSYLQEVGDVSTWMGNGSAFDVLVRPDTISRVSRFLRERHVNFDVIIPDVQQAIDQENPPLPPELIDELEGRAARYARWKEIAYKVRSKFPVRRSPHSPNVYGGGSSWLWKGHRMEWSTYHRLDDIHGYLDYLAQTFPEICSVMSIGTSVEGRPLKVIRISNNKAGAPAIWIDGGIHAREWISPASVTYIINYLVENSETLEAEYYILPVVNPDGTKVVICNTWSKNQAIKSALACSRFWFKPTNRSKCYLKVCSTRIKEILDSIGFWFRKRSSTSKNFPAGLLACSKTTPSVTIVSVEIYPYADTSFFRTTSVFPPDGGGENTRRSSALDVNAFVLSCLSDGRTTPEAPFTPTCGSASILERTISAALFPSFTAFLSFHSYGQYILYPWGYDRRVPPDYTDLDRVGQQAAAAMKAAGGAGSDYTVGNSASTLYAASGGSDDWAKAIHKIKYTYTIELRDTGKFGFVLPARYIIPTAKEALAAVTVITEASKKS